MASTNESHVAIHVAEDEAGHYEKAESPTAVGGAMPDNIRSMHHKSAFASHATVLLKWENISYQVEVKNSATKKMESKTVLEPMSGFAKPGELLVIMGPSGAGKTSLLNVLSGRILPNTGSVTINGLPWSKKLLKLSSYVQQDDLFYGELTVEEHLVFNAKLRLDKSMPLEVKLAAVKSVLEELNLVKCRDSRIGYPGKMRGISGGERKRLAIATEILVDPSIMFVDEPTSGLDSFMAEQVVQQLQSLAQNNRTIITTIHQPSSDVFSLFDKLLLVADGRIAYFGKAERGVTYFGKIGFQCPSYTNPADYFMKKLSTISTEYDVSKARIKTICEAYDASVKDKLEPTGTEYLVSDAGEVGKFLEDPSTSKVYKTGFVTQVKELAWRATKVTLRNPLSFKAKLGQSIFLAVLVGLIYLRISPGQNGIQDFNGALFFIVVNQSFSNTIPVVQSFPNILPLFLREHRAGMYSVGAFFTALTGSDIPFQVLWPVVFGTIAYWMIGFSDSFSNFLIFLVIIVLISNTAISLAYMISCVSASVEIALVLTPLIILPFMIFGGFFINENSIPEYFYWLSYLSFIRYGFHAIAINQWKDVDSIPCDRSGACVKDGAEVLDALGIDDDSMMLNIGVLIGMVVAFRFIAFLFLYWRTKRSANGPV